MLNIVIITPGFAVDEKDTICIPFLQLYIKNLAKQDVQITIITTQYPASSNYSWHGINVITLVKKEPKLVSKLLFRSRLNNALHTLHKNKKIDVIHHIWLNESVYISNQFAVKHHIKHVTTFPGQDVLPENEALKNISAYKGHLVCSSLFQQLKFKEHYNYKTELIHFGIEDVANTGQARPIDLLCCGWVNPIKNHSQFIDIVYELAKSNQIKKAVICGSGTELPSLTRKIEALDLQHIIEIKGSIQRSEVIALMKQSKVFVHNSTYEGFGLVLAEGLACGCKVISTPVGIAYNDTQITTCNTTNEFVNEIKKQLQSSNNIFAASNQYPINETTEKYLALYKK